MIEGEYPHDCLENTVSLEPLSFQQGSKKKQKEKLQLLFFVKIQSFKEEGVRLLIKTRSSSIEDNIL